MNERRDLYNKNQIFKKIKLNNKFPQYILKNKDKLKEFIE